MQKDNYFLLLKSLKIQISNILIKKNIIYIIKKYF